MARLKVRTVDASAAVIGKPDGCGHVAALCGAPARGTILQSRNHPIVRARRDGTEKAARRETGGRSW